MKITVDIDGCIGDFVSSMADWTARNKHVYNLHDPSTYAFDKDAEWGKAYHTGKDFLDSLQQAILDGVYADESILPLSSTTINALHHEGNEIIIATDRAFNNGIVDAVALRDTEQWLKSYGYNYDRLIITPHKERIDADVFIEDSPNNMSRILDTGRPVIKIPHAYNMHAACSYTMPVWNMEDIMRFAQ